MGKVVFRQSKKLLTLILLVLWVNVWDVSDFSAMNSDDEVVIESDGNWKNGSSGNKSLEQCSISIFYNSDSFTIQDSNPVNTITVRITHNDSGATVFENVYPKGQTSFIVIPMNGWSAGSYTIELFGRENNGYLWGTFQVLP